MSLSWSSLIYSFAPYARESAGIRIGRNRISVAHVERRQNTMRILSTRSIDLEEEMFNGDVTPQKRAALRKAIDTLSADLQTGYIPVQVTLPDPLGFYSVLELDSLPKSTQSQRDLVKWRYSRDHHYAESEIECAVQSLGTENGKCLLAGEAIERSWLNTVRETCADAGIFVVNIDLDSMHQFNQLQNLAVTRDDGAALLSLAIDSWTLSIWDDKKRLRFMRSRWRAAENAQEYNAIASETERLIRAYVRSGDGHAVANLSLLTSEADQSRMQKALAARMQSECPTFSFSMGLEESSASAGLAEYAISAAVCR